MRHIALFVAADRFDDTVAFYREGMGLTVDWQPDSDNVYLTSGRDNVAVHRVSRRIDPAESPLDHFGFLVPTAGEVRAWHERLSGMAKALSIELLAPVKQHRDGATSFYLADPAGTRVQIIHLPTVSD